MQNSQTNNIVTPNAVNQSAQTQATATGQMPGLQQVQEQVAGLRRTLHELMLDSQYADGEIMTATAAIDAQLEDYFHTLRDKKQPGLRTF